MATTTNTATFPASSLSSSTMMRFVMLTLTTALMLMTHPSLACMPVEGRDYSKDLPMSYKFAYSPVVVSGVPQKRYEDANVPTLYSVDFEVYCVMKGDNIRKNIRINDAGIAPGLCTAKDLTVGMNHLVFLQLDNPDSPNAYVQLYERDSGNFTYLQDAVFMCGAKSEYPMGVTEATAAFNCPPPNDQPDDCLPPPTTEAPPIPDGPDGKIDPPPDVPRDAKPGKDGGKGASYESVVDESNNNSDKTKQGSDGDKDAAITIAGTWALTVSVLLAIFQLV